ncbi:MAG: hypothetical protein ABL958_06115 [Bdellovibrionia bacterium]
MEGRSFRWGYAAFAVVLFSLTVQAAQESTSTTTAPPKPASISGKFLVQTAGTLNQAGERGASGLYLASGSYKMPLKDGAVSVGASIGFQRLYLYEGGSTQTMFADTMPENRNWDWIDPRVSLMRKQDEALGFDSIGYGVKATIAGLSFSSERKTQVFGIGPSFNFTHNVGKWLRGKEGRLTLNQSWDYRYIHHNYKTRNSGTINSPHSFSWFNNFGYSLGSRTDLTLSLGYSGAVSYQDVIKSSLGAGLEFGYVLSNEMNMALGFSNDTTGFAADGQSRELNLMNPDSATFYFNLDLTI